MASSCLVVVVILLLLAAYLETPLAAGSTFTYHAEYDLKPIPVRRQMVWRALIDWNNPANWQPDYRLPCAKDRVALPEDYILFLNQELDTIELV